jgi:hypothetical protein
MSYSAGDDHANPYKAPDAPYVPALARPSGDSIAYSQDPAAAEAIRKEHIARESRLVTIVYLMYIRSGVLVAAAIAALFSSRMVNALLALGPPPGEVSVGMVRTIVVVTRLGFAAVVLVLGYQLSRFKNWARWLIVAVTLFSASSVGALIRQSLDRGLTVPLVLNIGHTTVYLYILYNLLFGKNRFLFSNEYRSVVDATPQLRPRMGLMGSAIIFILVAAAILTLRVEF